MEVEIGRGKKGRRAYGFDDIAIVPSRRTRDPDDIDITSMVGPYRLELPLLASAMDGVVSPDTAGIVGKLGGLGVLNLEGIWTRYEDPDAELERISEQPKELATTEMQRIYAEPIKEHLIAQRIREIKEHGVVAAASLAHDYIGIDLSSTGEEALRWCTLVYAGLPVAFLVGVLRTHLRRAILGRLLADLSRGSVYEDPALQEAADGARRALRSGAPLPRIDELTPRELEVLALIAEGRTDRGIAKELYVTPKTVEAHIRSIFRKLDLPREETQNRRVHAVLTFLAARTP